MLNNLKFPISADSKDVCDLFDFLVEKKRTEGEINSMLCSLAHCKYPYSKTLEGHELRKGYKIWLRRKANRMLRDYFLRKNKPISLNSLK